MHFGIALVAVLGVVGVSCSQTAPEVAGTMLPEEQKQDVEKWQATRLAKLTADDGWLTLAGLFWIEEGESKVGSDPLSDVVLPAKAPKVAGKIVLNQGKARFVPAAGVDAKETELKHDEEPDYPVIKLGSVSFYLILRGERYGIRVKDTEREERRNFAGLEYYPIDPSWRVLAKLTPDPHQVTFATTVGLPQTNESPGYFEFERNGEKYKLDAVREGEELFWVIRDATSGKTTYAAARYIYTPLHDKDGRVWVDFNRAYNPPCVFTDYATCPLPPQQNRITAAVEAGEKAYAKTRHP